MLLKLRELRYLARDFVSVVRGTDYFHQPQGLGSYFVDRRCYYNDLRGKADWNGPTNGDVPLYYIPALERSIKFPIMVFQFGLGSLDRWLLEGDARYHRQAVAASRWTIDSLGPSGSFRNYWSEMNPHEEFFSDNSAMAQGQALSLLVRAVRYLALDQSLQEQAKAAATAIVENMLLPLESGGTCLVVDGSTYFCEVCTRDRNVILNGWIFALFGLRDYCDWQSNSIAQKTLAESVQTLRREAASYLLPCGWSAYDTKGRLASPFYHGLHIALLDAENRLTSDLRLADVLCRLKRADTLRNRLWFTANKVKDKLLDRTLYGTAVPRQCRRDESTAA